MTKLLVELGTGKAGVIIWHRGIFIRESSYHFSYKALKDSSQFALEELGSKLHGMCENILRKREVPQDEVTWQLTCAGQGRERWSTEELQAMAKPPFELQMLSLQQEAMLDIASVRVVAQHEAQVIGFLGSGTQSVAIGSNVIAIGDGGAGKLPTRPVLSNYQALLDRYPRVTCRRRNGLRTGCRPEPRLRAWLADGQSAWWAHLENQAAAFLVECGKPTP